MVMTPPRPSAARREEHVPGEGVDRGTAGQRVAGEVLVDGGQRAQVREEKEKYRDGVEMLGEAAGPRRRLSRQFGCAHGRGPLGVLVGDGRPRNQARRCHCEVLVPALEIDVA